MRVLWLSNRLQSPARASGSGTWLEATAHRLLSTGDVELGNISFGGSGAFESCDAEGLRQWATPHRSHRDGRPLERDISPILDAISRYAPDVVHVWGTESYWGLLTGDGRLGRPAMLEMQGVKSAIAKVYFGGLAASSLLQCVGMREVLRGATLWQQRNRFERWRPWEEHIIQSHSFITVQSQWLEAQVRSVAPAATLFRNDFLLREDFYAAQTWTYAGKPILFCSAAYPAPFKGLHVAIRALAILRRHIPTAQLRIAGSKPGQGIRRDGYTAWLDREARSLGLADHVTWLGPLTAPQIVHELLNCAAFVVPTFVEGYCLALCEAMALGVPSIASYAGGVPDAAGDGDSVLFTSPGDDVMLAAHAERIIRDPILARRMSGSARETSRIRSDPDRIVQRQLEIYAAVAAGRRT